MGVVTSPIIMLVFVMLDTAIQIWSTVLAVDSEDTVEECKNMCLYRTRKRVFIHVRGWVFRRDGSQVSQL